jgi:hypothetical protein
MTHRSARPATIRPDDNGIERGTFTTTVAAATAAKAAASPGAGGGAASGGVGDVALPLALAALVVVRLAWFVRRSR